MGRRRLYDIWRDMKRRCYDEKNPAYEDYGGRGISVCDAWRSSFAEFERWALASGYNDALTIDRREGDGNYSPENCRWATKLEQSRNKRKRRDARTSNYKGVSWAANVFKWRVKVYEDRRAHNGGLFLDEREAARQYDRMATKIFGEFASLNFPGQTVQSDCRQRTFSFA